MLDLRVFTIGDPYISHARAHADYRALLAARCTLVDTPAAADVVLLHREPSTYRGILQDLPGLQSTYRVGYCVWEADRLPPSYRRGIAAMDELWTASAFCHGLFSAAHPNVHWLPHVVGAGAQPSAAEAAQVDAWLRLPDDAFVCLTITKQLDDARKNVVALRRAAAAVRHRCPRLRLVVKAMDYGGGRGQAISVRHEDNVVVLTGPLSAGAMAALYARAHLYVAAHCGEGWGLPLSEAMARGVPAAATKWSGNLDFMTAHNSLLIDCAVVPVSDRQRGGSFAAPMAWAAPYPESIVHVLMRAQAEHAAGALQARAAAARRDIALFDAAHVGALLDGHLARLAGLRQRSGHSHQSGGRVGSSR